MLVAAFSVGTIILYQNTARSLHARKQLQQELTALRAEGAELKERLYRLRDIRDPAQLAGRLGLIKDGAPRYFGAHTQ